MTNKIDAIKKRISGSKLIKGFVATILGSGASKIILVLATFVCSNLLGKMEFGELSFVRNTLNMILCICALNFTTLCTKFTTEAKTSVESLHRLALLFIFSIGICVLIGGFLVFAPESLLLQLLSTATVVKFFKIVGVLLPLFMLQPLIEGVLRGLKLFKLIGILQTASSAFYLGAVYGGIVWNGLDGALIGVMAYFALYSMVSVLVLWHKCPMQKQVPRLKGLWAEKSSIKTMILPLFLMSFIDAPVMWVSQVILSKAGSMEAIGSMTAMMQIRNLAMLIPSYFTNTYIAFAGELNAQKNYSAYYLQYQKVEKIYWIIGISMFVAFSIFAQPILYLYGKDFVSDWPAMIISNLAIPLSMLIGLYRMDLLLKDHQQALLYTSIAWNAVWLLSQYIMVIIGVNPLYSFFASQLLGAVAFIAILFTIYLKDKKNLLKYEK